jgi:hypothetical protein
LLTGFLGYSVWLFVTQSAKVQAYIDGLNDDAIASVANDIGLSLSKAEISSKLQDSLHQLALTTAVAIGLTLVLFFSTIIYFQAVKREQANQQLAAVPNLEDIEHEHATTAKLRKPVANPGPAPMPVIPVSSVPSPAPAPAAPASVPSPAQQQRYEVPLPVQGGSAPRPGFYAGGMPMQHVQMGGYVQSHMVPPYAMGPGPYGPPRPGIMMMPGAYGAPRPGFAYGGQPQPMQFAAQQTPAPASRVSGQATTFMI